MIDDTARTREAIQIARELDEFGPVGLQYLADAPILNPNALFLPAGKISKEEADRRERQNWRIDS